MLNRQNLALVLTCLMFSATESYAAAVAMSPDRVISVGAFAVGIGSTVNLKTTDAKATGPAIFLGNALKPDGSSSYQMYLNKANKKVYYIDANNFSKDNTKLQTILDTVPQAGGTCTGYAIDNFLQQTNFSGFVGTGALAGDLSTEDGRSTLLVDAVNQYYLVPQHKNSIVGIMNGYGKNYGFKCKKVVADTFEKAKSNLLANLTKGSPVIVSFNIGPNMAKSPFGLQMFDPTKPAMDDRLWVPRKTGERNSGGHSIVAAGSFELNNKTYMVMIDSDWSEPRVWDMDAFLNDRTQLDEIEFISCK